ncbi:MAG: radical SAM protein [Deltaproteobacteria bacterium]|nr:MAG: radical SAM protein [Deltaproteobacteria bacterium]
MGEAVRETMLRVSVVFPGPSRQGFANLAVFLLARLCEDAGYFPVETLFVDAGRLCDAEGRPVRARRGRWLWLVTLSYEEQWPALVGAIGSVGSPLRARDRGPLDPIVVAGGMSVALNPEPLRPFLDGVFRGDAEPVVDEILSIAEQHPLDDREALSESLAALERSGPVRFWGRRPACSRGAAVSTFGRMLLVEASRGCPVRCRFCAVGHLRRVHFFPASSIIEAAGESKGASRIGLVGAALSWHPEMETLLEGLERARLDLSPSSLDARLLAGKKAGLVARAIERSGLRTITLAPEAGSERLRLKLGKRMPDDALERAVETACSAGAVHVKLYVMYGLPGESDDDLLQTANLVRKLRRVMNAAHRSRGSTGRISVSANPFIPKPLTPWAEEPMQPLAQLRRKRRLLKQAVERVGGVDFSGLSPRLAVLQCMLDRAGPEAAALLEECSGRWPPPSGMLDRFLPGWLQLVCGRLEKCE